MAGPIPFSFCNFSIPLIFPEQSHPKNVQRIGNQNWGIACRTFHSLAVAPPSPRAHQTSSGLRHSRSTSSRFILLQPRFHPASNPLSSPFHPAFTPVFPRSFTPQNHNCRISQSLQLPGKLFFHDPSIKSFRRRFFSLRGRNGAILGRLWGPFGGALGALFHAPFLQPSPQPANPSAFAFIPLKPAPHKLFFSPGDHPSAPPMQHLQHFATSQRPWVLAIWSFFGYWALVIGHSCPPCLRPFLILDTPFPLSYLAGLLWRRPNRHPGTRAYNQ